MNCSQAGGQLAALHDGELDGAAATALRAHVADCPHCRAELADSRSSAATFAPRRRAMPRLRRCASASAPRRRRRAPRPFASRRHRS